MLFMVIERYKNGDPQPIYEHLRKAGRGLPDGVKYIASWIETNFDRCFIVLECDDATKLMEWVMHWREHVTFEIVPVATSLDTQALMIKLGKAEAATSPLPPRGEQ